MERTKRVVKGMGKVILALLTGVLMPLLIWVALGTAINRKMVEKSVQRKLSPAADETLEANPATAYK